LIGLVIVTHGQLAIELRRATEHVVGPQDMMETICIGPDDDMEKRRADIRKAVERVDMRAGVILLTDMFGGTPSNLAISMLSDGRESASLAEASLKAKEAGQRYIAIASKILSGES